MEEVKVWRYYDLVKFFALIKGEIYFARADKFKDKYEGAIPKKNFQGFVEWSAYGNDEKEKELVKKVYKKKFDEKKRKAAISCWHINENESAAMWEIYSKAGQGIAVRTTIDKLNSIRKPDDYELEKFEVNYIDFDNEYKDEYNYQELLPFKNKRSEFQHEREYRMLIYQNNFDSMPFKDITIDFWNPLKAHKIVEKGFVSKVNDMPEKGISIKIDSASLIDEIVASPYMESYEIGIIQNLLDLFNKENNTNLKIRRSNLYNDLAY
jgi:hypothetical protein